MIWLFSILKTDTSPVLKLVYTRQKRKRLLPCILSMHTHQLAEFHLQQPIG